jgi:SAM-dependent methyltransferase
MADVGWTGVGVEPSASQCARARQLLNDRVEIQQTVLENADIQTKADLVTLWDVLEHVTDPVGFLQLSAALLKNDGVLILNVPRIDSFAAKHLGDKWPLLLAEHLNYFTPESLRVCARRAGLDVITFGSRPSSFSLGYILYRLRQHALPGVNLAGLLVKSLRATEISIPVWMGEIYAVFKRSGDLGEGL